MNTLTSAIVGLLYALLLSFVAFLFVGGGHGWISSFWVSLASIAVIPVASVASAWRRRLPQLFCLLAAVVYDIILVLITAREGFEYVQRSLAAVPVFVLGWILLWCSWQVALLVVFFRPSLIESSKT